MYKVFLVDDEIVVREGIRENVNWEETNFVLAGEAPDGEMALPLILEMKPDILVTDIKMPFMDGLALSRVIKKKMPWVKIIILSGHDEFNYAKEAISIGVTEYLLKPISSVDLIKSLETVSSLIESEKLERENIERLKSQLNDNSGLQRDRFLNELCLGMIQPADAIEKCALYKIDLIARYYLVEIIELGVNETVNSGDRYSEFLKVEAIISGIIENNSDIIIFKRDTEELVIIYKGDSLTSLEENAYSFAQSIKYEVERNTEYLLTIGIGYARERIQGLTKSIADAETAKNYKYIFGRNKIIGIKDIKTNIPGRDEFFKLDKTSIMAYLKYGAKSNINDYLSNYIQYLSEPNLNSLIFTYYAFMDLILTASKFVCELGGNIDELVPEISSLENILADMNSIGSFKKYAELILARVFDYRDSRVESKYCSIVAKAKEYINEKFYDPELSLISLASYVNMSPSHFSTIFSQETGETFIGVLTATRIRKAMELLRNTSSKSSEIAYSIGYNDPHYFSYLFKKVTGLTPKEYRLEGQRE